MLKAFRKKAETFPAGPAPKDSTPKGSFAGVTTRASKKNLHRFLLLGLGMAILLGLVHFSPLSGLFDDIQGFRETLDDRAGFESELLFLAANALCVAVGAPRLIFYAIAGATFDFWEGLLLAQVGTLTGSFLTYKLVRCMGRDWVKQRFGKRLTYKRLVGNMDTPSSVFLLRQLPISSGLLNLTFGLSALRSWPFLVGSFFGYLPQGLVVLLIADGIMEENVLDGALRFIAAIVTLVIIGALGLRRKHLSNLSSD